MKKAIFLFLINFSAFAQVFELDSTFKFEDVTKKYNGISPRISQLPNGLLFLSSEANIFNESLKKSNRFLLNDKGEIIEIINNKSLLDFDYLSESDVITPNNKFVIRNNNSYPSYKLVRYFPNGDIDSTFSFASYNSFIYKTFLLPNNNLMVVFAENNVRFYHIFDTNGKLIKIFNLAQYDYDSNARLDNFMFNEFNECFMLILDEMGNAEVIKTNDNFEIDKSFPNLKFKREDATLISLVKSKNDIVIYQVNTAKNRSSVTKYDSKGKKLMLTNFGKVSQYDSSLPKIYIQTDGSIDLIFYDKKHIKISSNGSIDSTFYNNIKQEDIDFLHTFANGTYWIMQNKSGIIEKMYADGNIDADFKIRLQYERRLLPNQINKTKNNSYAIDFVRESGRSSPFSIRYSPHPNCVRIYNNKHQVVQDFFDSKTTWKTDKTDDKFIVRGDGKIYTIDSNFKMSITKDTLDVYDVIDWKNNFIYKRVYDMGGGRTIKRYKFAEGLDENFAIENRQMVDFKILDDGRIAVRSNWSNGAASSFILFDIYKADGQRDTSVEVITVSFEEFKKILYVNSFNIESCESGFILTANYFGGSGGITQLFVKYNKEGRINENYQSNLIYGGQFIKYSGDGTIYINSANLTNKNNAQTYYNFLKILPNGLIDSTFAINGVNTIYDYSFFDENTIYATNDKTLNRFIKKPLGKAEYFYYQSLPTKITWNDTFPLKINIRTTFKNLKISVTGNGILQDSVIKVQPKAGLIQVFITKEDGTFLTSQTIEVMKIIPTFIYDLPKLTSLPANFIVKSSSGLPVKIYVNGSNYTNEVTLTQNNKQYFEVKLLSEGNEQYEKIEKAFYVFNQEPLANEATESIKFYPNPARDFLIIEAKNIKYDAIKLISITGKEIPFSITEFPENYQISLKNLPTGLYLLQIQQKNKRYIHKIWVE